MSQKEIAQSQRLANFASKKTIPKTAEATGDLIGHKIVDQITPKKVITKCFN